MTSDVGRRRYVEFQRLGRELGRPTDELLTLYAMEAFLARAAESSFADQLVLKGGMLMSHIAERRPTRDIDLQALALPNRVDAVLQLVAGIAAIELDDGITFGTDNVTIEEIRKAASYQGLRAALDAHVHTARLRLKIDFSFGDPIEPGPERIALDRMHPEDAPLILLSFPLTMVLAEKAVTAIARGSANTRWRDFSDVIAITRSNTIDGGEAYASIATVAKHRHVELYPLFAIVEEHVAASGRRWEIWHRNQPYEVQAPLSFREALLEVARFTDTAISSQAADQTWRSGTGWQSSV
jgi:hypothetical protein